MQSSAHTEWRAHLEGARRIIQLRGGLKKIIRDNPFFKPILIYVIMLVSYLNFMFILTTNMSKG